jgi:DNA-binding transcriptional LysR family regulator
MAARQVGRSHVAITGLRSRSHERVMSRWATDETVIGMELRHLRYFVAVAEELHFRRAAERLHIAQPAVSEQIRNLERELGVQLFERTQRAVSLTPAGAALLDEARRILRLSEDARRPAQRAGAGVLARLRIARPPDVLPMAVLRALRRFAAAQPDVEVTVEALCPRAAVDALRRDLLDIAIVSLPAALSGLTATEIGDEGVVVALPDVHPGLGQPAFPIEQLSEAIMLPRSANPPFYDGVLGAARDAGVALRVTETAAPSAEAALVSVAASRSPALLSASVAQRHAFPGVRFLPLAEPMPRTATALVTAAETTTRLHTVRFVRTAMAMARPAPRILERAA